MQRRRLCVGETYDCFCCDDPFEKQILHIYGLWQGGSTHLRQLCHQSTVQHQTSHLKQIERRVFERHVGRYSKTEIYHKEKEAAPARYWPVYKAEIWATIAPMSQVQWDAFLQRLDDELQLSAKILKGNHQSKYTSPDTFLIDAKTGGRVTLEKYLGKDKKDPADFNLSVLLTTRPSPP